MRVGENFELLFLGDGQLHIGVAKSANFGFHVTDYAWTADDYKVSATMQDFFANFIKTGNPNGEGLPEWPAAEAENSSPPVMILDTESNAVDATMDERYLFLDKSYNN